MIRQDYITDAPEKVIREPAYWWAASAVAAMLFLNACAMFGPSEMMAPGPDRSLKWNHERMGVMVHYTANPAYECKRQFGLSANTSKQEVAACSYKMDFGNGAIVWWQILPFDDNGYWRAHEDDHVAGRIGAHQ